MERIALAGFRRCLRNGPASPVTLRCVSATRNFCTARNTATSLSSLQLTPTALTSRISRKNIAEKTTFTSSQRSSRYYSSTKEGTIASGSAGSPPTSSQAEAEISRPTSPSPSQPTSTPAETSQPTSTPEHLNPKERQIWEMLMKELQCSNLEVQDISGGCGSMYGIDIVSERFKGLSMLKQQRLVNEVLGEEIKGWHGVQLKTRAP